MLMMLINMILSILHWNRAIVNYFLKTDVVLFYVYESFTYM